MHRNLHDQPRCDVLFLCVYLDEAHADDEWPIRTLPALRIRAHRTLEERCAAAARLAACKCFSHDSQSVTPSPLLEERCAAAARLAACKCPGKYGNATGQPGCIDCPSDSTSTAGSAALTSCTFNTSSSGLDTAWVAGKYTAETGSPECTTCLADDTGAVEWERCCGGGAPEDKVCRDSQALTWPIVVDSMDNSFNRLFAAWPVRAFIVDTEGRLVYILQPRTKYDDEGTAVASYYDFRDLEEALQSCVMASHDTQDTA